MGNLCGTAKADQGGGVLDLNQRKRSGGSRNSEAQQGASGRSDQQDQSTPASAASKGQEGANGGGVAAAGVGVKVACTGSKVEALAVDYLKNEVPGDRAIYGQDRLESRGDDVLVEEIGEPEEREMHWQQGELIGAGAFGRVYLGLDLDSGQLMAVKQVSIARDEALKGQVAVHVHSLEAEVMVLKQLHHPNIVRYLGTERVSSDMSSLNIFLEFVPGGSIASLLSKFGSFTESVLRVYTKQILLGLEFLHTHQIMHRDIKGANILVDNTGVVKLADFGASKKIEDLVTMDSGFKSIKGTPYWMAPEVIKQTGHGRQADIWSVGCTVIEMATGKPPWSEFAQPVSALFKIASSKDPPPIPQHLSPEAQDFLLLCFNRVPKDRPNATRLLQHPFLSNPLPTKSAAPSRIPPSNPVPQQKQQPPQQQRQQQPPPPQFDPPPAIGTGFRFVPTKPMSPITEVNTLTTPEANGSRGNGGRPPIGPPSASPTPSSVNTVTPSPKPAVDFFGNLRMDTHQSGGHDPLGSSVAFSVADSVVSDSMSYNPIEEPSWLAQSPEYDPSNFMMADGLPPPQPLGLYNSPGKENRAGRSSRTPPGAGPPYGPAAVAEQVAVGDERRIMSYVQEKAARDWARLSTPLFETGFGGAEAQAAAAAAAAAAATSGGKNDTSLPSGDVLRADNDVSHSSARGPDTLTQLHPTGDFVLPSPKPQQQRRAGRPVRPPSISSQSLQQAAEAAASGGGSSSRMNLHGSSSSRPDKSRQWEEELEKELAAERARKKTPRS